MGRVEFLENQLQLDKPLEEIRRKLSDPETPYSVRETTSNLLPVGAGNETACLRRRDHIGTDHYPKRCKYRERKVTVLVDTFPEKCSI